MEAAAMRAAAAVSQENGDDGMRSDVCGGP